MIANTATTSSTTQYEMVEQLAHKCGVTLEEAKAALEANNWNVLTATYQLEHETFKRKQELNNILSSQEDTTTDQTAKASSEQVQSVDDHQTEADEKKTQKKTKKTGDAMKKLGHTIMDLIKQGNRNRFVIHRNGEQLLDMPVTILVLLLLGSFGTCAFLMVIGLFLGCRYTINGIGAAEA